MIEVKFKGVIVQTCMQRFPYGIFCKAERENRESFTFIVPADKKKSLSDLQNKVSGSKVEIIIKIKEGE